VDVDNILKTIGYEKAKGLLLVFAIILLSSSILSPKIYLKIY
jgi:hypothetical protein